MSRRQIRRLTGNNTQPPPDSDSDDDFDAAAFHPKPATRSYYAGLEFNTDSDSSAPEVSVTEESDEPPRRPVPRARRNQKRNKKVKQQGQVLDDEIDKSVREINEMLGVPPPAPFTNNSDKLDLLLEVNCIQGKHLNVENELRRLFGSDEDGYPKRKVPRSLALSRKILFFPMENYQINYIGLAMSVVQRVDDITYFTFDHSQDYQRRHRMYLQLSAMNRQTILSLQDELRSHVDSQLEVIDALFKVEENSSANSLLEFVIVILQKALHPLFNLSCNIRLEYKYLENRSFFNALLKYMYILTNRACHRTALEIAKLLLRIDPSDPVAVLLIIDTVALRAREHEWLLKAIEYWSNERDAGNLFNIMYSKALATFHVATKKNGDITEADELLIKAIEHFPSVALRFKEEAKDAPAGMNSHELFALQDPKNSKLLDSLMKMYAKLISPRWREPPVAEWLNRNIKTAMQRYTDDPSMQERVKTLGVQRYTVFQGWPIQMVRHILAIQSMSNLIADGCVPILPSYLTPEKWTGPNVVNRYNYHRSAPAITNHSFLESLFANMNFDENV